MEEFSLIVDEEFFVINGKNKLSLQEIDDYFINHGFKNKFEFIKHVNEVSHRVSFDSEVKIVKNKSRRNITIEPAYEHCEYLKFFSKSFVLFKTFLKKPTNKKGELIEFSETDKSDLEILVSYDHIYDLVKSVQNRIVKSLVDGFFIKDISKNPKIDAWTRGTLREFTSSYLEARFSELTSRDIVKKVRNGEMYDSYTRIGYLSSGDKKNLATGYNIIFGYEFLRNLILGTNQKEEFFKRLGISEEQIAELNKELEYAHILIKEKNKQYYGEQLSLFKGFGK